MEFHIPPKSVCTNEKLTLICLLYNLYKVKTKYVNKHYMNEGFMVILTDGIDRKIKLLFYIWNRNGNLSKRAL